MDDVMSDRTNQRVEQQTKRDRRSDLAEHAQVAEDERCHGEGGHQARAVTTEPLPAIDRMIPVLMPA
jgi:hypothetical protein